MQSREVIPDGRRPLTTRSRGSCRACQIDSALAPPHPAGILHRLHNGSGTRMIKIIAAGFIALAVVGCATQTLERRNVKVYKVGDTLSAPPGGTLLSVSVGGG